MCVWGFGFMMLFQLIMSYCSLRHARKRRDAPRSRCQGEPRRAPSLRERSLDATRRREAGEPSAAWARRAARGSQDPGTRPACARSHPAARDPEPSPRPSRWRPLPRGWGVALITVLTLRPQQAGLGDGLGTLAGDRPDNKVGTRTLRATDGRSVSTRREWPTMRQSQGERHIK